MFFIQFKKMLCVSACALCLGTNFAATENPIANQATSGRPNNKTSAIVVPAGLAATVGQSVSIAFEGSAGATCAPTVDWGAGQSKSAAGTSLPYPVTYKHTYAQPGNYNVHAVGCGMVRDFVLKVSALSLDSSPRRQ